MLIVESDPDLRHRLKRLLKDFGECQEALDRETALDWFQGALSKRQPFDLVTIDIAMPDMQKSEIIKAFRAIEGATREDSNHRSVLLVITAHAGRQTITDCMLNGCDDVITTPFEDSQVLEKLIAFNLIPAPETPAAQIVKDLDEKQFIDAVTRLIHRGTLQLPPAPKIAMRIRQLVGSSADMESIIALLKQDLSISTKLIHTSNSVAYGGVIKNTSIGQAVRRLGIDRAVEVVMSICCRGYFVTNHPPYQSMVEDLWWHSLGCAHASEMIVQHKQMPPQEDLFALGLLHDVGKLVLIQAAGDLQQSRKSRQNIAFETLQAAMAEHHRRLGVLLLEKWGYAKSFTALIHHHRSPQDESSPPAMQVLHEADLLAKAAGFDGGIKDTTGIAEALEQMGYTLQLQEELKQQLFTRMEQLRYTFG